MLNNIKKIRTSYLLLFGIALIILFFGILFKFITNEIVKVAEEQRKHVLVQFVSMAKNTINPVIKSYKTHQISKSNALDSIRSIVRLMRYNDQNGENYIFMSDYNGKMLVQPYQPQNENSNQINLQDLNGKYIIRELIQAAKSPEKSGFVTYFYYPPNSKEAEEKLAYVMGIPELECYIGTGVYMGEIYAEQQATYNKALGLFGILLVVFLLPLTFAFFELRKQNNELNIEINDRKKAEQALKQSEARLNLALDSVNDGLWDWNLADQRLYFSPRYYKMLGYEPNAFESSFENWKLLVHPEDLPRALDALESVNNINIDLFRCEFRMRAFTGEWSWILARGRVIERNDAGQPSRMIGTHSDISYQKKSEERLRQSEENLKVTLNSIGDGVIATDRDGNITRINPEAQRLTGWSYAEAYGKKFTEVFNIVNAQSRQKVENPVERVFETGEIVGLANHTVLIAKNGIEYHIADSASPIKNKKGELLGVVLVFRDVSEQYRLEDQLRQSQKMEVIGQLAGGVAHDFNNMLTGIIGASEYILLKSANNNEIHRFAEIIVNTAQKAGDLTRKLLAFSRKAKFYSTPIEIHHIINETVSILEHTIDKRITIEKNLAANGQTIIGDPSLIQNAIMNIALNARDAMPEGGKIVFSTSNIYLDEHFCKNNSFKIEPGNFIEIAISDTGAGIPKEIFHKIFEPFFTTKPLGKGTGLGLAAVYGAVKDHLGAVSVYSEIGQGSIFKLYIPLSDEVSEEYEFRTEQIRRGSGTILLIDDDSIIRNMVNLQLTDIGFHVITAEDGLEGLDMYKQNEKAIDCVILDLVMPKLSGKDTLREIRMINPDAKIILSSGFSGDSTVSGLLSDGKTLFLQKPFKLSELSENILKLVSNESKS